MSLFEFHNAGLLISPSLNKSFFYNLMQMASLVGLTRVSDNAWTGFKNKEVPSGSLAPIIAGSLVNKNPSIVVEDFI